LSCYFKISNSADFQILKESAFSFSIRDRKFKKCIRNYEQDSFFPKGQCI
jgi:hypothetical protein